MNKKFFTLAVMVLSAWSMSAFAQFSPKKARVGTDSEWVVNFFRVNNPDERLYEDANSVYSKGKGLNFLGVEGKGDEKNTAMLVKYTRGKVMPQYLIMLGKSVTEGTEYICPICQDPDCTHSKVEIGFTDARFLVSLTDSLAHYEGDKAKNELFTWNDMYARLAFVDGRIYGDSVVVIKNSAKEPKENRINVVDVNANGEGKYSPVLFSFRLLRGDQPDGDFLIESCADTIASREGQWIKIQNGVPVITQTTIESAEGFEAEIFNIEYTTDDPVANVTIDPARVRINGGEGLITIEGAQGKTVHITNLVGQTLVTRSLTSDNEAISLSPGVVIVAVEGKPATKVLVK